MKTITLTDQAYERLKSWKTGRESFSEVVLRTVPKRGRLAISMKPSKGSPVLSRSRRGSFRKRSPRRSDLSAMNVDRLVHTDFLIDRWRNGEGSGAAVYARAHRDDSLALPWIVKAEFLHLMELAGYDAEKIGEFLGRYPTYWPDDELLVDYARLGVTLRSHSGFAFERGSLDRRFRAAPGRGAGDPQRSRVRQGGRNQARSILALAAPTARETGW